MSTLKVNKLRDTAGSADAITLDPNGGAVLAGVTTISTARVTTGITSTSLQVGAAVTITESGIEASGIGITCANINGTQIGGRRNLIINGAMLVAQRGTSSTTNGYGSVDRFVCTHEGTDEAVTHAQVDVASGTTPYSLGFRKAMKLTNGNQTGGGGGNDNVGISQAIEAQHIASSGWNYKSSSSFITVSFWVKSSVAQNFYGYLYINDGTAQLYSFETGSLTADTWTKIIKKVPGNSNITINNDNGFGMQLQLWTFLGTNYTGTTTLNQWANYSSSTRVPDMTTTWYTTNDSTFEMTGVQIEVGPEATSFEHRAFGEELLLCQRYYYRVGLSGGTYYGGDLGIGFTDNDDTNIYVRTEFTTQMRAAPTAVEQTGDASEYKVRRDSTKTCSGVPTFSQATAWAAKTNFPSSSHGWGTAAPVWGQTGNSDSFLAWSAEL